MKSALKEEKNSSNYAAANSKCMETIWTVVGIVEAHKLLKLFIRLCERQMKNWDDDDDDDTEKDTHAHAHSDTQRKKHRENLVKPVSFDIWGGDDILPVRLVWFMTKKRRVPRSLSLSLYLFTNVFWSQSPIHRRFIRALCCCFSFTLVNAALCNRVDTFRFDFYFPTNIPIHITHAHCTYTTMLR